MCERDRCSRAARHSGHATCRSKRSTPVYLRPSSGSVKCGCCGRGVSGGGRSAAGLLSSAQVVGASWRQAIQNKSGAGSHALKVVLWRGDLPSSGIQLLQRSTVAGHATCRSKRSTPVYLRPEAASPSSLRCCGGGVSRSRSAGRWRVSGQIVRAVARTRRIGGRSVSQYAEGELFVG